MAYMDDADYGEGPSSIGWRRENLPLSEKLLWLSNLATTDDFPIPHRDRISFDSNDELLTLLCQSRIPIYRAAWCLVTNFHHEVELDSSPASRKDPVVELTKFVCEFMEKTLKRIAKLPPRPIVTSADETEASSRPVSSSLPEGAGDEAARLAAAATWRYLCRLTGRCYHYALLARFDFLLWIMRVIGQTDNGPDGPAQRLAVQLALQYRDIIVRDIDLGERLAHVCCRQISRLVLAYKHSQRATSYDSTRSPLTTVFNMISVCPLRRLYLLTLCSLVQMAVVHLPQIQTNLVYSDTSAGCDDDEGEPERVRRGGILDSLPCLLSQFPSVYTFREARRSMEIFEECLMGDGLDMAEPTSPKLSPLAIVEVLDRHRFHSITSSNNLDTLYERTFTNTMGSGLVKAAAAKFNQHLRRLHGRKPRPPNTYFGEVDHVTVITTMCEWAITTKRQGAHRAIIAATLIRHKEMHMALQQPNLIDAGTSAEREGKPIFQDLLVEFLDTKAPTLESDAVPPSASSTGCQMPTEFENLVHLFTELMRLGVFSYDHYVLTLQSWGYIHSAPGILPVAAPRLTFRRKRLLKAHSCNTDTDRELEPSPLSAASRSSSTNSVGAFSDSDGANDAEDNEADPQLQDWYMINDEGRLPSPVGDPNDIDDPADAWSDLGDEVNDPTPDAPRCDPPDQCSRRRRHLLYATQFPHDWLSTLDIVDGKIVECIDDGTEKVVLHDAAEKAASSVRRVLRMCEVHGDQRESKEAASRVPATSSEDARVSKPHTAPLCTKEQEAKINSRFATAANRLHALAYHDQHVILESACRQVMHRLTEFASGRCKRFPRPICISYLLKRMEKARDIYGLICLCREMLGILPNLSQLLKARDPGSEAAFQDVVSLEIVSYLHKYHCYIIASQERVEAIWESLCAILEADEIIHWSTSKRCAAHYLNRLYQSCPVVSRRFEKTKHGKLCEMLERQLYATTAHKVHKPEEARVIFETESVPKLIAETPPLSILEYHDRPLLEQIKSWKQILAYPWQRFHFVCRALFGMCSCTDTRQLTRTAMLCTEVTSAQLDLPAEWQGLLATICGSWECYPTCRFGSVVKKLEIRRASTRESIAVLVCTLASRRCLSVGSILESALMPSLKAASPNAAVQTAPSGVRLACHLVLHLLTAGRFVLDSAMERELLLAACIDTRPKFITDTLDILIDLMGESADLNDIGIDDLDKVEALSCWSGLPMKDFAKYTFVQICSQSWVQKRFLQETMQMTNFGIPRFIFQSKLTASQAESVVRILCYSRGSFAPEPQKPVVLSEPTQDSANYRCVNQNHLVKCDNLSQLKPDIDNWSLRLPWLELQLLHLQCQQLENSHPAGLCMPKPQVAAPEKLNRRWITLGGSKGDDTTNEFKGRPTFLL